MVVFFLEAAWKLTPKLPLNDLLCPRFLCHQTMLGSKTTIEQVWCQILNVLPFKCGQNLEAKTVIIEVTRSWPMTCTRKLPLLKWRTELGRVGISFLPSYNLCKEVRHIASNMETLWTSPQEMVWKDHGSPNLMARRTGHHFRALVYTVFSWQLNH